MSRGARAVAAVLACALHLALLAPEAGGIGGPVETDFAPEAEAIEDGSKPYSGQDLEYPPLAIPVLVGPALVGEGLDSYTRTFHWEMIGFDLAIVLMLALGLRGGRREVLGALAVYTLGVVAVSGIVFDDSDIDPAPLALGRFDLAPAALALAALLARDALRSATWGALLAAGVAVKAFPLALLPALARGERDPLRVVVAAAVPLAAAVALVIVWGDDFGSALSYHGERGLQIESLAATPLEIGAIDDPSRAAEYGSGSFNYVGPGAAAARVIAIGLLVFVYGLVAWAGWRSHVPRARVATALLATVVVLAPVLSPQFLFWLLPLSAAAFGLAVENVLLVAAMVMTQLMLQFYGRVPVDFDGEFVWRLAGRNALLLAYLALLCAPILRAGLVPGPSARPRPAD
ncbi:MAG: glycosyltransferase 87 family protein [Solirubrobacterales bacterium]